MLQMFISATLLALSLDKCSAYGNSCKASDGCKTIWVSFKPPTPWQYDGTSSGKVPVQVRYPAAVIPSKKVPLLVMLHSYGQDPESHWRDFGFQQVMSLGGQDWLVAVPPGRRDEREKLFWAASGDNCGTCSRSKTPPSRDKYWYAQEDCNGGASVNTDVDFIQKVVKDVDLDPDFQVDLQRVYLFGHSNGAYMAYRMWCDIGSDVFAAAVAYAGATPEDNSLGAGKTYKCNPGKKAIPVLHIHATGDESVTYEGCGYNKETGAKCSQLGSDGSYPWAWAGAAASVEFVCQMNGCDGSIKAHGCSQPPKACVVDRGGKTCLGSSHLPCEAWTKSTTSSAKGQKSIIKKNDTHVYKMSGSKLVELWKIDGSCHHPGKDGCTAIPSTWDSDGYEASVKNWLLQFRKDLQHGPTSRSHFLALR